MEENFSIRLQKAMNIRNIKAVELSEKTGIPKSSLSEYIKGKYVKCLTDVQYAKKYLKELDESKNTIKK